MRQEFTNTSGVRIDAGPPATVESALEVSAMMGTVRDVNVVLDIDHTWTADLAITLVAPGGQRVRLVTGEGQSGDHFRATTFDDAATVPVWGGQAPFSGAYRPDQPLRTLDGIDPNGVWRLEIQDQADQDGGRLNFWRLTVETCCYWYENRIPVAIDPGPPTLVQSFIEISSLPGSLVQDVNVALDIRHSWVRDLGVTLVSPAGTRVQLVERRGGNGDDFRDTVFDDSADTPIADGTAPFVGQFRPEQPLSALRGETVAGVWSLEVEDNAPQDGGALNSWTLVVVTGNATAPETSRFNIEVEFRGGLTANQRAVFELAAARWAAVIVGDLPDATVDGRIVDDVLIEAEGTAIDGRGGILGQAGPRTLRAGSTLPASGVMAFDTADLAAMEADGSLVDVIVHEMGHVLGLGTIWGRLGLVEGTGGVDPVFLGPSAMREYGILSGAGVPTPVPVANTGGPGTRDAHWRENILGNELMTGFLGGAENPLSRLTIAALEDMGYAVDYGAADDFTLPTALRLAELGVGAVTSDHAGHGMTFFPDQEVLPPIAEASDPNTR